MIATIRRAAGRALSALEEWFVLLLLLFSVADAASDREHGELDAALDEADE